MTIKANYQKILLSLEFLTLFIFGPIFLYFIRHHLKGGYGISIIIFFGTFCLIMLLKDKEFDRELLWNSNGLWRQFKISLLIFSIGSILLTILTIYINIKWKFLGNDRFYGLFPFVREIPELWLILMIAYPILSVYPQTLIYRTFMFHRYQALFTNKTTMIVASGLTFGLGHIFFANWIAPVLTLFGGLLFAQTYSKNKSTLQSALEHALWGCFIFTIGLGDYFYSGAIR